MGYLSGFSWAAWLMLAAGVSGFVSAILMSAPAFLSIDSRETLVKLTQLKLTVDNPALLAEQEKLLLRQALGELAQEKRYLQRGLALLALSFALTITGTLISGDEPAGTNAVESGTH